VGLERCAERGDLGSAAFGHTLITPSLLGAGIGYVVGAGAYAVSEGYNAAYDAVSGLWRGPTAPSANAVSTTTPEAPYAGGNETADAPPDNVSDDPADLAD
jgi:hypothetical protein